MLLVVGTRLGDIETAGYTTIVPPGGGRALIHVHPDPDEIGRVYEPTVGIVASGPRFAESLARLEPLGASARDEHLTEAHAAYRATLEARPLPGAVEMTGVMEALRARLGPDAILTSGAGNFTVWAHRFYVFRRFRTQLAPLSGAMGYGLPAAIAAKLVHPDRDVVCLAGDGDFLMAHGAFFLLGGYIALKLQRHWVGEGAVFGLTSDQVNLRNWVLPTLIGALLVGAVGLGMQQAFLRWNQGQELRQALITIAIAIILADQMLAHFGGVAQDIAWPGTLDRFVDLRVAGVQYTTTRLFILGLAIAVGLALWLWLKKTRTGMTIGTLR